MDGVKDLARQALPGRAREALRRTARRARALLHPGDAVECPCCGGRFGRFLPFGTTSGGERRQNARCPGCGSMERHRLLWMYLEQRTDLFTASARILHVAPEEVLHRRLSQLPGVDYVTADLDSPLARDRVDVTSLPYADDSFDAILCNHVLEHVPDDRRALRELSRVLRPGGWAILQVPIRSGLSRTLEDPSIRDPMRRLEAFGQEDHVRVYGRDYADRLAEAGFRVRRDPWVRELPREVVERHQLKREDIFYCTKPRPEADC